MHSHEHSCEWVRERIDALIDDDFGATPDERASLERHIASCAACAGELAWARTVREQLSAMAFSSAPSAVVAHAEMEIAAPAATVVPIRARGRLLRRASLIAAAAALIIAAIGVVDQRRRAADQLAVEQAARDAAVAFAYVGKYTRRTGEIVESEVIEQRLLAPVGKAMEKSGVGETKSSPGQS